MMIDMMFTSIAYYCPFSLFRTLKLTPRNTMAISYSKFYLGIILNSPFSLPLLCFTHRPPSRRINTEFQFMLECFLFSR